jgi:DNA (cytosine-5)-methyltransferase 1
MSDLKVISLFSGAGGLDYGVEAAGFKVAVALEMDHDCCVTLENNTAWPVIEKNIFDVPTGELLERGKLRVGEADLLVGGPPCQPFSKAGYWKKGDSLRLEDPRASTLSAYMRVLREARPRAFLLENVEGLAYEGKDEGMRLLEKTLDEINAATKDKYRARIVVLNAADFGVPQLRRRVFVIGARDGTPFIPPPATHADASEAVLLGLEPYRTAWDALAGIKPDKNDDLEVGGKWGKLLPSIPEGENYLWHTDRGGGLPLFGWRRHYWTFLLKLAKARPASTIQAQPGSAIGPFHWESRRLSRRELCAIQTFPKHIKIQGSLNAAQRQVGNAVPSLLAEVLGREIRRQLLGAPIDDALKLLPERRKKTPPPERVAPVPKSYRKLIGEHEAHPGTGKGRGALQRDRERAERERATG